MDQPGDVVYSDSAAVLARALVDLRDRVIQKTRIQFNNRVAAMDQERDSDVHQALILKWHAHFEDLEKALDADIATIAESLPIVQEMTAVKGIGTMLAVKVAALIDIERADTVSALWKYAGYGVTEGARDRLEKGEKAPYNIRLKTNCFLVGESFIKCNSPYRRLYDEAKAFYETAHPDWTPGHRHNAARRKMIKLWLSHLWVIWRTLEGLPVSDPYIIAGDNNHHRYIGPEQFGWG